MNIWIFNHHAQSPEIPGGTRHYDLAKQLVLKGHHVTIFAAGFHYTLLRETVVYENGKCKVEMIDDVKFIWVKTYPYLRNNWKRFVNIVSYAFHLNNIVPKLFLAKPDIIIGTTVHPFAAVIAYRFSKKYKVPFIFEIRDLWPQSFIDMGIWKKGSLVSRVFKYIEKYTVNHADSIISLSPKTQQYLLDEYQYVKTTYIPNSVDIEFISKNLNMPSNNETIMEVSELKKKGFFLCMFTGAIVKTNTIHIFLEIAKKIKNKKIYIVLVGQGQEREYYESLAKKEDIKNIIFLDPVEKILVPKLLKYADILLLVQGNIQWGSSNKLFDYMAARKPIVTSLYAKHNNMVNEINCGYSSEYNNSKDTMDKIMDIYNMRKEDVEKMKENAYNYVCQNHDIKLMVDKLERLCKSLTKNE